MKNVWTKLHSLNIQAFDYITWFCRNKSLTGFGVLQLLMVIEPIYFHLVCSLVQHMVHKAVSAYFCAVVPWKVVSHLLFFFWYSMFYNLSLPLQKMYFFFNIVFPPPLSQLFLRLSWGFLHCISTSLIRNYYTLSFFSSFSFTKLISPLCSTLVAFHRGIFCDDYWSLFGSMTLTVIFLSGCLSTWTAIKQWCVQFASAVLH